MQHTDGLCCTATYIPIRILQQQCHGWATQQSVRGMGGARRGGTRRGGAKGGGRGGVARRGEGRRGGAKRGGAESGGKSKSETESHRQ